MNERKQNRLRAPAEGYDSQNDQHVNIMGEIQ